MRPDIPPSTTDETMKIIFDMLGKEPVKLNDSGRDKLVTKLAKELDPDNYFVVMGTLWELLKYMVANSPDTVEKWMSVRWLLSEVAKFSQEDYGKQIAA